LANVFIAADGVPWLIDFGFAELAADDVLVARDTAELLASTSAVVGPERSVAAAIDVMGRDTVATALPWMQPLALSSATHSQIGDRDDYARLHSVATSTLGLDEVRYEKMERVSRGTILIMASVALALYVVIPQLTTATGFLGEVADTHLGWAVLVVVASVLAYVGGAVSMAGAVPVRLRFPPILLAQLAAAYSSPWPSTALGGVATNTRFLLKQNLSLPMAETVVWLVVGVESATYWALTAAAAVAAGRVPDLPDAALLAAIVGTLLLLAGILVALPSGRRLLTRRLQRFQASWAATADLARTPAKLLSLYAGAAAVFICSTAAMLASLQAVGADLPIATSAFVYLLAAGLASNVPTPGAIGATEAALFAGYLLVQVPASTALAAVLLFRFVTFWFPLLPGWLALRALRRSGRL
jgi:undecaprenyl-diphosphatase